MFIVCKMFVPELEHEYVEFCRKPSSCQRSMAPTVIGSRPLETAQRDLLLTSGHPADVKLVVEDAGAALGVAIDRARAPCAADGPGTLRASSTFAIARGDFPAA